MEPTSETGMSKAAHPESKTSFTPPKGARASLAIALSGREFAYQAEADWIILRKDEKPSAERIRRLMKLDEGRKRLLTVQQYDGGHMFYTWEASRIAFSRDMETFFNARNPEST